MNSSRRDFLRAYSLTREHLRRADRLDLCVGTTQLLVAYALRRHRATRQVTRAVRYALGI